MLYDAGRIDYPSSPLLGKVSFDLLKPAPAGVTKIVFSQFSREVDTMWSGAFAAIGSCTWGIVEKNELGTRQDIQFMLEHGNLNSHRVPSYRLFDWSTNWYLIYR